MDANSTVPARTSGRFPLFADTESTFISKTGIVWNNIGVYERDEYQEYKRRNQLKNKRNDGSASTLECDQRFKGVRCPFMVLAVASNSNSWKVYERQGCNHTHQIDEANNGIVCESAKKLGSQESEELNNGPVELPKNVEDKDSSSIILESPKKIVGSKDSSPIVTESPKKIVDSKDSSPIIAELPIDEANNGIACEKSADSEDSSPIIVESPKKIVGSKDSSPIIAESSKKIGSLAASKALTEVTRSPDIPPFSIDAMLGSSELNPEQIQSPRENIRQRKSQSPKKIPSANQDHDDSKELETTDTEPPVPVTQNAPPSSNATADAEQLSTQINGIKPKKRKINDMESSPLTQSTSDECTSPESSTLAEQPSPKRIKLETTQSCAISTNHIFRSGKRWEFLCPVQDDEHLAQLRSQNQVALYSSNVEGFVFTCTNKASSGCSFKIYLKKGGAEVYKVGFHNHRVVPIKNHHEMNQISFIASRLDREQEAVPNHDNSDSLINASSQSNGKDVSKSNAKKALDERHNKVNPRNEDDVFNFEEMSVSKDDLKEICRANKYILKLTCDSGHTQFYGQKNVPGYTLMAMKCNDGLYSLARPCQVDEP